MNISINVDCSPEEARRFMGLPDLTPLHDIYLDRFKAAITDGVTPEAFDTMLRSWMPMGDAGMNMWKRLVDQMTGTKTPG
ncbi:DUF6489 family protein [Sphingomonas bacterium]|uniref:DUF6489 family protein n=1 Tax=Sphingomonas bacterium TaxID=1895847 RepID=UPI001576DEE1|nr:DUF6489 family protein [Sphingomonas bacterium]